MELDHFQYGVHVLDRPVFAFMTHLIVEPMVLKTKARTRFFHHSSQELDALHSIHKGQRRATRTHRERAVA